MVITIDGPAGSGKSTVARKLAARLGIAYLDTGAMYRAIAHQALERGFLPDDADALSGLARSMDLELDCGPTHTRVRVDGLDVSEAIRSMAVSRITSRVAKNQAVRDVMVEQQRKIGKQLGSFVTEGRDQGSVVFPNADVKFVLEATPEKRAHRRLTQMEADGEDVTFQEVLENLTTRDEIDSRHWSSLLGSGAAVVIDTTDMNLREVVDMLADYLSQ